MAGKIACEFYRSWREAKEPLASDECQFLEQGRDYLQFCDMGLNHEYFQKVCPWAGHWGH